MLIVDDDAELRDAISRYLRNERGFECLTVASGSEALLICVRSNPDAVILDINLGDINGFDVFRALRVDPRTSEIPVLLLTGGSRLDSLEAAGRCSGAAAFLRKPIDFREMVSALRQTLAAVGESSREEDGVIVRGPLRVDSGRRLAFVEGVPIRIGRRRLDVLCALARSKEGLSEEVLRAMIWGPDSMASNIVSQTISRLRGDLERICGRDLIASIPGGYRLV